MSGESGRVEPLPVSEADVTALGKGSYELTEEQLRFLESQGGADYAPIPVSEEEVRALGSDTHSLSQEEIQSLQEAEYTPIPLTEKEVKAIGTGSYELTDGQHRFLAVQQEAG
jgi:hypothetical protein